MIVLFTSAHLAFALKLHLQSSKMSFANLPGQSDDSKICVVMVGLPARGKSLIAGKGKSN
jgi:hypothetical protein